MGALSHAIKHLLTRLDVARERNECVVRHTDFYRAALGDDVELYSALFEPDCRVQLDRDLAMRLMLALDRVNVFDDSELLECSAIFHGAVRFAPGVVWAHACCLQKHHIAVLPLSIGEGTYGRVSVTVDSATTEVFFVTDESHHVGFFRAIVALENLDEAGFERLARSAFPALEWADDLWRGLGDFNLPYIEIRDKLVRSLGGLSDYGAEYFHHYRSGDPRDLQRRLSAKIGSETSDENGRTKRHLRSELDRTRSHRGTNKVFWWHVKLRPNVDRIHFLYESPPVNSPVTDYGHIVVGLFKDHCILPN